MGRGAEHQCIVNACIRYRSPCLRAALHLMFPPKQPNPEVTLAVVPILLHSKTMAYHDLSAPMSARLSVYKKCRKVPWFEQVQRLLPLQRSNVRTGDAYIEEEESTKAGDRVRKEKRKQYTTSRLIYSYMVMISNVLINSLKGVEIEAGHKFHTPGRVASCSARTVRHIQNHNVNNCQN